MGARSDPRSGPFHVRGPPTLHARDLAHAQSHPEETSPWRKVGRKKTSQLMAGRHLATRASPSPRLLRVVNPENENRAPVVT